MKNASILAIALSIASFAAAQQDGTFPPGGGPGGQDGQRPRMDPAQMLERMDANGDGKLAKDEVPAQLAERMFERADTNKDGFLDKAELEAMAKAGPQRGGQGGQRGGQGGGAPVNLEGAMKQMNGAYKALKASAFDAASKGADLEAVQRLQMAVVGAKGGAAGLRMTDEGKSKFGGDKAAFEAGYRRKMLDTLKIAVELEIAILDGKSGEAKSLVGKLHDMEESGHDVFKGEEQEERTCPAVGAQVGFGGKTCFVGPYCGGSQQRGGDEARFQTAVPGTDCDAGGEAQPQRRRAGKGFEEQAQHEGQDGGEDRHRETAEA